MVKHAKNYGYLKIPRAQMGNHKLKMLQNREKMNEKKIQALDNQIDIIKGEISSIFAERDGEEAESPCLKNKDLYMKTKETKLDQLLAKKNKIKATIRNERA